MSIYLNSQQSVTLSQRANKLAQLFLFLMMLSGTCALAQTTVAVNPPSGGFRIDGELKNASTWGDWALGTGTGGYVFNNNKSVNGSLTANFITEAFDNSADFIFTGGSSFSDPISNWSWTQGKPTSKCDMNNGMYLVTTMGNNKWMMLGGDRFTTQGTSYIDFEFLQKTLTRNSSGGGFTGERTVGDFVLSMEYSNGGTNALIHYYRWELSGGTLKYVEHAVPLNAAYGATKGANVETPFGAFNSTSSYIPYSFVEAAVNIDAIISANTPCAQISIKTLFIKTKASDSYNAALKDFLEPQQVSFQFGTAGISYPQPAYCEVGTATPTITGTGGGTFTATPAGLVFADGSPSNSGVIDLAASTPGEYTVTYQFAAGGGCNSNATTTVKINGNPAVSASIADICEGTQKASLTYSNLSNGGASPEYKLTSATAALNMSAFAALPASPFNIPSGSLSSLASGPYSATLLVKNTTTGCTSAGTPVSFNIKSGAAQPTVTVTPPTCSNSNGTVTVTAPLDNGNLNYEYSIDNGASWTDDVSFTVASGAAYSIIAREKTFQCNSAARTGTMGTATATPDATAIITQDVSCSRSTGKVKIVQASSGNPEYDNTVYEFSNDGQTFGSNPEFTFKAGEGYSLTVRRKADPTCTKTATCQGEAAGITSTGGARMQGTNISVAIPVADHFGVKAFPNPFNDKINFVLTTAESGNVSLEIYNMLGQNVKTVYRGFVKQGTQNFEVSIPASHRSTLIYVVKAGNKQLTGKLLQAGN